MKRIIFIFSAFLLTSSLCHAIPNLDGLPHGAEQKGFDLLFDTWEDFYNWEYKHCLGYPLARHEETRIRKIACTDWLNIRKENSPFFFSIDMKAGEIQDMADAHERKTGKTSIGYHYTNKYPGYCTSNEKGNIEITGVLTYLINSNGNNIHQESKVALFLRCTSSPTTRPTTPTIESPKPLGRVTCGLDGDANTFLRSYVQLVSTPLNANYTAPDWSGLSKNLPDATWHQGNGQGDFPVSQSGKTQKGALDLELIALGNPRSLLAASARYTSDNGNFSKFRDTLCASPNIAKKLCDTPTNSPEKGQSYYQISVGGFKPVFAKATWGTEKGGWFSSKNKAWESIELRGTGAKAFDFPETCPKLTPAPQVTRADAPPSATASSVSPQEQLIQSIVQMHQQVLALYETYKSRPTEENKQKLRTMLKTLDNSIGKYKKTYQMDKRVYDSEAVPADMLKAVDYK